MVQQQSFTCCYVLAYRIAGLAYSIIAPLCVSIGRAAVGDPFERSLPPAVLAQWVSHNQLLTPLRYARACRSSTAPRCWWHLWYAAQDLPLHHIVAGGHVAHILPD